MRAAIAVPGARSFRRIMLACLEGQRKFRAVPERPESQRWARSWARRWFVVDATSADAARDAVRRYIDACVASPTLVIDGGEYGIVEAGRNGPGGPREFPREGSVREFHRPSPAARARRRARSRAPTARGQSLL